jgi:hypothetical protein
MVGSRISRRTSSTCPGGVDDGGPADFGEDGIRLPEDQSDRRPHTKILENLSRVCRIEVAAFVAG